MENTGFAAPGAPGKVQGDKGADSAAGCAGLKALGAVALGHSLALIAASAGAAAAADLFSQGLLQIQMMFAPRLLLFSHLLSEAATHFVYA